MRQGPSASQRRAAGGLALATAVLASGVASSILLAPGAPGALAGVRATAPGPAQRGAAARQRAAPACGDPAQSGTTPVRALGMQFVLPTYWLCVPGQSPLPPAVSVLERVDVYVSELVPQLQKNVVGAFELLPGGKIPVVLTLDRTGSGPLPSVSTWTQLISSQAKVQGTTLDALKVVTIKLPAGTFLEATFSFANPGGATYYRAEYLGSIAGTLVSAVFEGSPNGSAAVRGQAKLVMETVK